MRIFYTLRSDTMTETVKERRVRLILIAFFLLVTLAGLFYRQSATTKTTNQPLPKPLAAVVKQGDRYDQNPIVALYEKRDGQNILALYEVEKNDSYHFRTLQAIILSDVPEELAPDEDHSGIWVKQKGKWSYFNERLMKKERKLTSKINHSQAETSFQTNIKDHQLEIRVKSKLIAVVNKQDRPLAVYFLTEDESVVLIVQENGVKISIIETK